MDIFDEMLGVVRDKLEAVRKQASDMRLMAEEKETEANSLEEAIAALETVQRDQDDFNDSARGLLG